MEEVLEINFPGSSFFFLTSGVLPPPSAPLAVDNEAVDEVVEGEGELAEAEGVPPDR